MMKAARLFVGAYAAYSSLRDLTRFSELDFLRSLHGKAFVRGLELPFTTDIHREEPVGFLAALPTDWDYVWTLLPGTMQSLAVDPHYGLASSQEAGRRAALDRCEDARKRIVSWHEATGQCLVKYVHLHSSPRLGDKDVRSSRDSLLRSLEALASRDWAGTELVLEHCDAYRAGQTPIKGFLSLDEELAVARQLGVKITINWGRSAIELRSASSVLEHIREVWQAKLLKGVFFSGTTDEDPLYGHWQDHHAPLRLEQGKPWEPQRGLLGLAEVRTIWEMLKGEGEISYGLKVQPFPAELSWMQRRECLEDQIQALQQLWSQIFNPLRVV